MSIDNYDVDEKDDEESLFDDEGSINNEKIEEFKLIKNNRTTR